MKAEKNLFQKLLEVKKAVPYLQKDKASYNYKYASGSKVLGKVNEILNEQGVILKSEVVECHHETITSQVFDKKANELKTKSEILYILKTRMTWVDTDNPESRDVNEWFASGVNGDEKGFGSALTYAERYFMLKYFNIATDDLDPDTYERNAAKENGKKPEPKKETISQETKLNPSKLMARYDGLMLQNKELLNSDEAVKWSRSDAWDVEMLTQKGKDLKYLIDSRKMELYDEKQ